MMEFITFTQMDGTPVKVRPEAVGAYWGYGDQSCIAVSGQMLKLMATYEEVTALLDPPR
jgi:hypothetical protein